MGEIAPDFDFRFEGIKSTVNNCFTLCADYVSFESNVTTLSFYLLRPGPMGKYPVTDVANVHLVFQLTA